MDYSRTVTPILDLARSLGLRIAAAESCTGGLVAGALTAVAGSSDVFECGYVTYSNRAKMRLLSVSAASLERFGAVSEAVAREMAEGALGDSLADIAVSVTGIAGPGGSEHKPEGRVCFGLAQKGAATLTQTRDFGPIGRGEVRAAATDHALMLVLGVLQAGAR